MWAQTIVGSNADHPLRSPGDTVPDSPITPVNPVNTADLYDERGGELDSISLQVQSLGGRTHFSGPVRTIRCL